MDKIIAVCGTTGSGKSALAVELAKRYNGEIVSCDSMQIYKYMDIGTAKPTKDELAAVPHHMIDIITPDGNYSLADFCAAADECIENITTRGRTVILCGGTGLYLDAVAKRMSFDENGGDEGYREELKKTAAERGNAALHGMLKELDPEAAERIHPNNVKRVIRTLEILRESNSKREHDENALGVPRDVLYIGVTYKDREKLYAALDARVDKMFESGLPDEVRALAERGFLKKDSTAGQAIGYKEFFLGLSTDEVKEEIKKSTRRYAKRQLTWLRRNQDIHWLYTDEYDGVEALGAAAASVIDGAIKE